MDVILCESLLFYARGQSIFFPDIYAVPNALSFYQKTKRELPFFVLAAFQNKFSKISIAHTALRVGRSNYFLCLRTLKIHCVKYLCCHISISFSKGNYFFVVEAINIYIYFFFVSDIILQLFQSVRELH